MSLAKAVNYGLFQYWDEDGDPRVNHYPLMKGGPLPILTMVGAYVYFVKFLGPRLMKDRKPFDLKAVIIVYNLYNILINLWFFRESLRCLDYGRRLYNFQYPPVDYTKPALHTCMMIYIYMLSKLVDFMDTIFFVLRKKTNQVTFLHVYHHSIVPVLIWMAIKLMPTAGPAGMFPLFNSAIHVIMYTYYTLSALGPKYRKYLFWKKYITILQLIQFICYTIHGTMFLLMQIGYPRFVVYLGYIQNPFFFVMFYQFFKSTYRSNSSVYNKKN